MSTITTHVLDIAHGRPAGGVPVTLERRDAADGWHVVGRGETDADGRLRTLMPSGVAVEPGVYRLTFGTRPYFDALGVPSFHPEVIVVFETGAGASHYHVPLLIGPYGYTTYRGS
jgi:5-hydroxyisourate hydrolase